MTFLNAIMLFGLAAVAIPIIIHILNRRRARVVDWAAMQFLAESVASRNRRVLLEEILLMGLRCLLLGLLALALARPFLRTGRVLGGKGADDQDIAIVLDGSLSMTLAAEKQSNFQRAIEEAAQVVKACRPGDAVSVILGGPAPQAIVPSPLSDHEAVAEALAELTAPGGSMDTLEALRAATLSLAAGTNPAKKIVLITDGQRLGWDLSASQRWQFLAEAAESLPTRPLVIARTLEMPEKWSNACAAGLSFSRDVIGTDRPVKVTATVANTGVGGIKCEAVELWIDEELVDSRPIDEIADGASSSVVFEPRFEQPGPHVVQARVVCKDDLPADNQTTRVVNVLRTLPVLIVQGKSSTQPLASDGDFLKIAMTPPPAKDNPSGPNQAGGNSQDLIRAKVVDAMDIASVEDFSGYRVVVLANAARLPGPTAGKLAEFVQAGGGLLIAPGSKVQKDFYDNWTGPDGKPLTGCRLVKIEQDQADGAGAERFAHVAVNTIDHPALKLLSDPSVSDLGAARIKRHWVLAPAENDETVAVAALLETGDPFMVQRKGRDARGFVITLALPLNTDFSDLPVHECECFVPMLHELLYYLAAPSQLPLNVEPGQRLVYTVPGQVRKGDKAHVMAPDGRPVDAELQQRKGRWQATYLTVRPGLHRLTMPDPALGELATRPAVAGRGPAGAGGIPFVVLADPAESRLEALTDDDYNRAGQFVQLARAETLSELTAAITGDVPGSEIWRYLALAVLALLVVEILATRAIAVRRRIHLAAPVAFGARQVDAEQFRRGAGKPAPPRPQLEEAPTP